MIAVPPMATACDTLLSVDDQKAEMPYTEAAFLKSHYKDHSCWLFHCAYFPVGEFWLRGHWIIHLLKPILISVVALGVTAIALYDICRHPFDASLRTVSLVSVLIFSFINAAFSYSAVIVVGPGSLPFTFPKFGIRSD
jgi:hypothetical protein